MSVKPLRIGVAGLGTVGSGVLRLLAQNANLIETRCGRALKVVAVSARDKSKKRKVDTGDAVWVDDPVSLAGHPDIDVVAELMGGAEGAARKLAEAALGAGRPVVTANKALIAAHGMALAGIAERAKTVFAYEAAVAGGIPIIKTVREALAANRVTEIHGILNGTCNYILTQMRLRRVSFEQVLEEAQARGYAEADPAADVDGHDSAHKLGILSCIAFGTELRMAHIVTEGIRHVTLADIGYADELGYRIKLLGVARMTGDGIEQRVGPCMVPLGKPLAGIEDVLNGIQLHGDYAGKMMLVGAGAGAEATASAVVADLIDLAAARTALPLGRPVGTLEKPQPMGAEKSRGCFYIRLTVKDKPGVVADIAAILRDHAVSMESMVQHGSPSGDAVPIAIATHETTLAEMQTAMAGIAALPIVLEPPCVMRIEQG